MKIHVRLLTVYIALVLAACNPERQTIKLTGTAMGTTYSITAVGATVDRAALKRDVEAMLDRISSQMSTWNDDSEISRFNRDRTGRWFAVSPDLLRVLAAAERVNRTTGGAFDITLGGLVALWGFGGSGPGNHVPENALINALLLHTGYDKFELDAEAGAIRKIDPELRLDLSGIAKGYGVDAIADVLVRSGIRDFIVEIGGEIKVSGRRADGTPWRVAIEKPDGGNREIYLTSALENSAIATSGDYRDYFEIDGKRYSHIIDPATGSPPDNGVASVSVISADAATADSLATALMVMGTAKAMALAAKEQLAVLVIERTGDGFESYASAAFEALRHD